MRKWWIQLMLSLFKVCTLILLLQTIIHFNFCILERKFQSSLPLPCENFTCYPSRELHQANFTDVGENCAILSRKRNRKRSMERHSMKNTWSLASSTTLEMLEYRSPMCITLPMLSCKFNVDPFYPRFIVVIAFDVERTKFPLESLQQSDSPSYSACRSKNASPKTIILLEFIKKQSTILSNGNLM